MRFVVEFKKGKSARTGRYPYAVLIQDHWDDYGYKSTFHVSLHLSKAESVDLGSVKIIEVDQTGGYTDMPRRPFTKLNENFASLGADLEYYETLYKLGRDIFVPYLSGLRDIAYNDEARAAVEDTEGYRVSLLRFSGAKRTIADAARLLQAPKRPNSRRRRGFMMKFKTSVSEFSNSFTVNFDFRRTGRLPNRINALIGYNGTGKTRLLSNLAIVASGYGYDSKEAMFEERAGRFVSNEPPVKSVIVVSYSAFDTFAIPGKSQIERDRLDSEGDIFGYIYCGLRERSEVNETEHTYRLRTPEEVQNEFLEAWQQIRMLDRTKDYLEILKPLLRDPSFQRIGLTQLYTNQTQDDVAEMFRSLSSGHKVVLKIISEITAFISGSEPTLVLIDEPETHLHPPLLASFLRSIRTCLETFDGYAVIATHSPVVLQETPARFVRVIRRSADQSNVVETKIETFAESIGVITEQVFNLGDGSADWHDTLRIIARQKTLSEIEEMFGYTLGFAAKSYIVSIRDEMEE